MIAAQTTQYEGLAMFWCTVWSLALVQATEVAATHRRARCWDARVAAALPSECAGSWALTQCLHRKSRLLKGSPRWLLPATAPGAATAPLVMVLRKAFVHSCAASLSAFLPTGSRAALRLHVAVPSPGMGSPAALATGDLAGDMEALAVTAPEAAQKDAAASQAEVDALKAAAVRGEMERLKGSPGGNVVNPDGAAVEASENPEADRVAEAFAQAVERIAKAEVTKVFQSAIAEVEALAASGVHWGERDVGACSLG